MSEEISKAYRIWREQLRRDQIPDIEQAFAAGYETSATLKTLQAWQAGYQNGECQMWQRVRDIVDERVRTYVLRQDSKDALAENSLNEHEKFRHTREAMDLLAELLCSIAPKKTLNFETGIAPAEVKEEAEHAGRATSTVAAWRYKDHDDDRWSFSDGPDGVAMADIIEPLFPLGAAGYLQGIEAAARFHEERAIAIRTDAGNYRNGRIDRSAYQASNFHEQAALDIRKLKDPDNAA